MPCVPSCLCSCCLSCGCGYGVLWLISCLYQFMWLIWRGGRCICCNVIFNRTLFYYLVINCLLVILLLYALAECQLKCKGEIVSVSSPPHTHTHISRVTCNSWFMRRIYQPREMCSVHAWWTKGVLMMNCAGHVAHPIGKSVFSGHCITRSEKLAIKRQTNNCAGVTEQPGCRVNKKWFHELFINGHFIIKKWNPPDKYVNV